jgi:hypothetical protein
MINERAVRAHVIGDIDAHCILRDSGHVRHEGEGCKFSGCIAAMHP